MHHSPMINAAVCTGTSRHTRSELSNNHQVALLAQQNQLAPSHDSFVRLEALRQSNPATERASGRKTLVNKPGQPSWGGKPHRVEGLAAASLKAS